MKLVRFSILFCCCLILLFGLPSTARAQSVSGSVRGTVKDSSGASIPNAQVTLTDTQRMSRFARSKRTTTASTPPRSCHSLRIRFRLNKPAFRRPWWTMSSFTSTMRSLSI